MRKALEILKKKRDGEELSDEDMKHWIECLCHDILDPVQISAMLMAMYIRTLSIGETVHLTKAMINSGITFDWTGTAVDKHSTGGVGDKISLPLAPALAALGLTVPMMSGRGLGLTGGTLDKLESIKGFKSELNVDEMKRCIRECGCFIAATTKDICLADKKMYVVRDVTCTIDCNGLIVGSILSKKIAEGAKYLVLDLKVGECTCYNNIEDAKKAADLLKIVASQNGLNLTCLITDMSHPIGYGIGNSLEVLESVECLKGRGSEDLRDLVTLMGGYLLSMCGQANSCEEGQSKIRSVLDNGEGLKTFHKMIINQGVDKKIADELCFGDTKKALPQATEITPFKAHKSGWVKQIDAVKVAEVCLQLGSGRSKSTDVLDYAVGAHVLVTRGSKIISGDQWIEIHHNNPMDQSMMDLIKDALVISDEPYTVRGRLLDVV